MILNFEGIIFLPDLFKYDFLLLVNGYYLLRFAFIIIGQ